MGKGAYTYETLVLSGLGEEQLGENVRPHFLFHIPPCLHGTEGDAQWRPYTLKGNHDTSEQTDLTVMATPTFRGEVGSLIQALLAHFDM